MIRRTRGNHHGWAQTREPDRAPRHLPRCITLHFQVRQDVASTVHDVHRIRQWIVVIEAYSCLHAELGLHLQVIYEAVRLHRLGRITNGNRQAVVPTHHNGVARRGGAHWIAAFARYSESHCARDHAQQHDRFDSRQLRHHCVTVNTTSIATHTGIAFICDIAGVNRITGATRNAAESSTAYPLPVFTTCRTE